jgi:hypothetical protein
VASPDPRQDRALAPDAQNRILLENYYLPGALEAQIAHFVEHYNHQRYHESLNNLTPADVYFGRGQSDLLKRERIKRDTIQNRRLQHQRKAAQLNPTNEPEPPLSNVANCRNAFDDGHITVLLIGDNI